MNDISNITTETATPVLAVDPVEVPSIAPEATDATDIVRFVQEAPEAEIVA